jgi:hypothetical protein
MAQKGGVTTAPVAMGQCGVFFPLFFLQRFSISTRPRGRSTFAKWEFLFSYSQYQAAATTQIKSPFAHATPLAVRWTSTCTSCNILFRNLVEAARCSKSDIVWHAYDDKSGIGFTCPVTSKLRDAPGRNDRVTDALAQS